MTFKELNLGSKLPYFNRAYVVLLQQELPPLYLLKRASRDFYWVKESVYLINVWIHFKNRISVLLRCKIFARTNPISPLFFQRVKVQPQWTWPIFLGVIVYTLRTLKSYKNKYFYEEFFYPFSAVRFELALLKTIKSWEQIALFMWPWRHTFLYIIFFALAPLAPVAQWITCSAHSREVPGSSLGKIKINMEKYQFFKNSPVNHFWNTPFQ